MVVLDVWSNRFRTIDVTDAQRSDCPTCGQRQFEFLNQKSPSATSRMCGRNAVQVNAARSAPVSFEHLSRKLSTAGEVQSTDFLLRCKLSREPGLTLSIFQDGRTIVHGTADLALARSVVARYVGS